MKNNKKNAIKLLKAICLSCRDLQDYTASKSNYESSEYYKKKRWILEDVIEFLEDQKKFDRECRLHEIELKKVEKM